jgi:hypothetical protein
MPNAGTTENGLAELYRQHITKVLESGDFANSRTVRQFLRYVSDAALEGRVHLEQAEIAGRVLNRGVDFNPMDDASVRKLATLTRQRLEKYQAGEGASDLVVMTLPLRSYVPVFRLRTAPAAVHAAEEPAPPRPSLAVFNWRRWLLGSILVLTLTGFAYLAIRSPIFASQSQFVIHTHRGDILHASNDAPPGSIKLGPLVSAADEVTVRMTFSPQAASQQAGIMIFENADRYVKLGRQFTSRNQWEFGLETQARYQKPPGTFSYDATGQDGNTVWLSIRRNHNVFEGFTSRDGMSWVKIGNTLEMPDPMPNARAAIYAYNGRTNASSTVAAFDNFRIGPFFHNLDASHSPETLVDGWKAAENCAEGLGTPRIVPDGGLDFVFGNTSRKRCDWMYTRAVPPGDWTLQTHVDFQYLSSTIAGLIVNAKNGYFRLIRWDINNGSITSEHSGHDQVSEADFPGNPAVTLRIDCKSGILHSSFSRDDRQFIDIANDIRLADLGPEPRFGIHAGVSSWVGTEPPPPARFYYIQRLVTSVSDYR